MGTLKVEEVTMETNKIMTPECNMMEDQPPRLLDCSRGFCFGDSTPQQFPLFSSPSLLLHILTSYGLDYQHLACLEATCLFFRIPMNLDSSYAKLNITELAALDMCRKRACFKRLSSDQKEDLKVRCGGSWKLVLRFLMTGEANYRRDKCQAIAGLGHSIVVTSSGKVYSFGNNGSGELGHGNVETEYKPRLISALQGVKITQVAVGYGRTMLVSDIGVVYGLGKDTFADMASDYEEETSNNFLMMPKPVEALKDIIVIQVSIGNYFTAVLSVEGKVYTLCWGKDERLGHMTDLSDCEPRLLSGPLENLPVVQIGAGNCYFLALAIEPSGMSVYSMGCGLGGKLGHGDTTNVKHPRKMDHFQTLNLNPVSMSVGRWHAAVLGHDGRVCTWGWGSAGCLGHGDAEYSTLPKVVEVLATTKAVHVSVGTCTTFIVAEDGNVFSFGWNAFAQLGREGQGIKPMQANFISKAINNTEKIVQISTTDITQNVSAHTFVLTDSGQLYAFGSGQEGKLGVQITEHAEFIRKYPVLVNIDLS